MTLLKCATLTVKDVSATADRYETWFDYSVVERGEVPSDLADSWGTPGSAGRPYVIMQPASGQQVFIRLVQGDPVASYVPISTLGWAATEICVQDVEEVNARMERSPFEIIGPPKPLDGFPTVKPMQVRGPDNEVLFLTEIRVDGPANGLPVPQSLVDRPFIMVLACSDLKRTIAWVDEVFGFEMIDPVAIEYTMISQAFDLPAGQKVELVTAKWKGEVFLELDQYPEQVTPRDRHDGTLPPGVAITTIEFPNFDKLAGHWVSEPVVREGALYAGKRVGLLKCPDGALLEVIERTA
ncbi:VOC family protein [Henriciella sp. AS95]|uniref:VOC family protein n=1 Tax=Henriciella sp. AS95 TaxID=3135782 RepID=UPI003171A233